MPYSAEEIACGQKDCGLHNDSPSMFSFSVVFSTLTSFFSTSAANLMQAHTKWGKKDTKQSCSEDYLQIFIYQN